MSAASPGLKRGGAARRVDEFYRLVYSNYVGTSGENYTTELIPKGPAHIHTVSSLAVREPHIAVDICALMVSVPLDFSVKVQEWHTST